MKTITPVSGGKSSAYIAANYPADYLLFALVTSNDPMLKYPDEKLRQVVSDRIGREFIGTNEDDIIIHTMLDLEQYLGKEINWVAGIPFDEVIDKKGGWLPNKLHRYCTTWLKIDPMFYWWAENVGEPVYMNIGFRANETKRASKMLDKVNENGLLLYKATFGKHTTGSHKGKNKWENIAWQKPQFPLIESNVYKDDVDRFWENKPVRFAPFNNCVHCFHRNPILLQFMYRQHPDKIKWAAKQEGGDNGTWRSDVTYDNIMSWNMQTELFDSDFTDCDSGYCGL